MQKVDKGFFSPPTSIPTSNHPSIHSQTRIYLFTRLYYHVPGCPCPRHSVVSLFIVSRGGFASVRPHSRADHSLGQEPVYLYTDQQCALVNVRKVYEIYAGGHNLVNVWKMGNRRCPAARSRVIHCGPKAPQGAHPLIL